MGTYAAFVSAMQGMTVTGVKRHYNEPPASIDISDGPAAFPLLPSGEKGEYITSCIASAKSKTMQYVIIIEAVGQRTQGEKYGQVAALLDSLETALDALQVSDGGTLAAFVEYTLESTADFPIGDSTFWAIVANVSIRDY
jgi:hypothetical protein